MTDYCTGSLSRERVNPAEAAVFQHIQELRTENLPARLRHTLFIPDGKLQQQQHDRNGDRTPEETQTQNRQ